MTNVRINKHIHVSVAVLMPYTDAKTDVWGKKPVLVDDAWGHNYLGVGPYLICQGMMKAWCKIGKNIKQMYML